MAALKAKETPTENKAIRTDKLRFQSTLSQLIPHDRALIPGCNVKQGRKERLNLTLLSITRVDGLSIFVVEIRFVSRSRYLHQQHFCDDVQERKL